MALPFEQQPRESDKAFAAFSLYPSLGAERSNAYYAAGCPLELCDHAAARDLWRVIYRDAIASEVRAGLATEEGV